MAPPTLLSMAQRATIRNIDALQDVGDIEYNLLKPILRRVNNPQQLRNLEINSPHIADFDSDLWRSFIARDIPQWEDKIIEPKNPRSWWKVYRKLIREEKRKKEEQEEQLKASLTGLNQQREANQVIVTQKVDQLPAGQRFFVDGLPNRRLNGWGQEKKPALQNAKTGKHILSAIRKQSSTAQREKGMGWAKQPAKAMVPSSTTQIKQAPEGMLRDHAKPVVIPPRQQGEGHRTGGSGAPKVFVSRNKPELESRAVRDAVAAEQAKKEDRLRALASGGAKPTSASSSQTAAPRVPDTGLLSPVTESQPSQKSSSSTTGTGRPSPALSSQPRQASPSGLSPAAGIKKKLSPSPASSPMKRPSTPVSIFMPSKKRKT